MSTMLVFVMEQPFKGWTFIGPDSIGPDSIERLLATTQARTE